MENEKLSHVNQRGKAKMVDIGAKATTERIAIAAGEIVLQPETVKLIQENNLKKGDVLTVAQIAGIQAAKKTSELIPLCHPILISSLDVDLQVDPILPGVKIIASVRCSGKTGAEMEAMTAVSIAGLTVYDMVKAVDRKARIQNIRLLEKHGGKSGDIVNE